MTAAQRKSAVRRKRAAGNPGGKPTNVRTFAKKENHKKEKKTLPRKQAKMPKRNKKNFRPTKKGAGMTCRG